MFRRTALAAGMITALVATAPASQAATVLTLEGGLVGMQNLLHLTPLQLQGDLCTSPNHCQPVDYFAFPTGTFTDQGAANVRAAIAALPADEQVVLFGHSQGGQVIYSDLRTWAADPAHAPDPARVSWVSIGNPEDPYGGRRLSTDGKGVTWLPPDTAYQGTEVIRQYDGWADWPDDTSNLLAVANAVVGMFTVHSRYWNVDLADPRNVRYTPEVNGAPGKVTYVWVPNDTLPLVAWAGPLAPALDNALRPIVEKAYHRPVDIPDPTPPPASAAATARHTTTPKRTTGGAKRPTERHTSATAGAQRRAGVTVGRHSQRSSAP